MQHRSSVVSRRVMAFLTVLLTAVGFSLLAAAPAPAAAGCKTFTHGWAIRATGVPGQVGTISLSGVVCQGPANHLISSTQFSVDTGAGSLGTVAGYEFSTTAQPIRTNVNAPDHWHYLARGKGRDCLLKIKLTCTTYRTFAVQFDAYSSNSGTRVIAVGYDATPACTNSQCASDLGSAGGWPYNPNL